MSSFAADSAHMRSVSWVPKMCPETWAFLRCCNGTSQMPGGYDKCKIYMRRKRQGRECVWCSSPAWVKFSLRGGGAIQYCMHISASRTCVPALGTLFFLLCRVFSSIYITFPGKVYGLAKVAQRLCLLVFSLPVELMEICTFMYF